MTTEVRLFNPLGLALADINVVPSASRIINDVGDASFTISKEDLKANENNLQFGNLIRIAHDKLPPWVGIIDSTQGREWGAGDITIHCLSAEILISNRIVFPTPMRGTTGKILKTMLNSMNIAAEGGIRLYPGDIYMGGRQNYYPLIGRCRDVMDRIAKRGKCDWDVTSEIEQGKLRLYVNLYRGEKGRRSERILDYRNTELFEPIYTEEGEIWNHVVFMRPLNESGEIKITRPWRNEDSIARYGLRMYLGEANAEEEEALDWYAKAWLYDHAYPRGVIMPTILDFDSTFRNIDLGNKYHWESHGISFSDWLINSGDDVRLTGYEVDYGADKIAATVESTRKPFDIMELFNE